MCGAFVWARRAPTGQKRRFPARADVIFVAASLGILSGVYGDVMKAVGASARVFELLDRVPKINAAGGRAGDGTFRRGR